MLINDLATFHQVIRYERFFSEGDPDWTPPAYLLDNFIPTGFRLIVEVHPWDDGGYLQIGGQVESCHRARTGIDSGLVCHRVADKVIYDRDMEPVDAAVIRALAAGQVIGRYATDIVDGLMWKYSRDFFDKHLPALSARVPPIK